MPLMEILVILIVLYRLKAMLQSWRLLWMKDHNINSKLPASEYTKIKMKMAKAA